MLGKFVLLIAASGVLSSGLKVDVDDLLALYERIDSSIQLTQHEAEIEIRAMTIPMESLLADAVKYVMGNLTVAAEPYWTTIASMEAEAEAKGEDISACVNGGNEELYTLNETIVNAPLEKIAAYRTEGNDTIYASANLAYSAIEELLELEVQVKACSDPECAEELYNALIEFHGRASETLQASVDNPTTYLNELPEKLAPVNIDADDYKEQFTAIIDAVAPAHLDAVVRNLDNMLGKIVFLIAASGVLSSGLKVDVDDLLALYERIDSSVKLTQHEAAIEIRALTIPMESFLDDAVKYVMGNLTVAAEPYWTTIASMEAEAEAKGEDISACVNGGNEELYTLNETIVNAPLEKIAAYRTEGNDMIYASANLAYSAIEELLELEVQVKACSDPECAEELYNALIEFHGRASETLEASVDNPTTYLNELPEKLALVNIDADDYKEKFTAIIDAVVICTIL
ncbi:hypothetical protein YQE_04919, partial [Dendroctonus ponderosae]